LGARMRCLRMRSLVLLLMLALTSGNARAGIHLDDPISDADIGCTVNASVDADIDPASADHHGSTHDHESGCCCDCLGCLGALASLPAALEAPVEFRSNVWFLNKSGVLADRPPSPDPDPPRTLSLS
jgi:hypothetical protein